MRPRLALLLTFVVAAAARAEDPLAANARAIGLAERSLEAHGGRGKLGELRLSFSVRADLISETQSHVSLPPFETYPFRADVRVDLPAKRIRVETDSSIAGDFRFREITALENGKGFSLTPEVMTYEEARSEPGVLTRFLPHRQLLQALQNRASLRPIDANTITFANGGQLMTLVFDPQSRLIRRVEQLLPMGVFGDGARELLYDGYTSAAGVPLPSQLTVRVRNSVQGVTENRYRYLDINNAPTFAASDFSIPQGYTKSDYSYRGSLEVKSLAKDVYLLENVSETTGQWSYNVLVVMFDDYVVVAEAPVSNAVTNKVLAKVRELSGGKPVRYVIQSHHHGDHLGGIGAYLSSGTGILAGQETVKLVGKIAYAPQLLDPDRKPTAGAVPKPDLAAVVGSTTLRDAHHELVIYNIGPSPHAADMLFVWLPNEKVLYQSDLVNDGEYPENATTRHFFDKLKELALDWQVMAGLHGRVRRRARSGV